jgi:hypothetical protein
MCPPIEKLKEDKGVPRARVPCRAEAWHGVASNALRAVPCAGVGWFSHLG